ncbi:hypothetical protein Chor_014726 [Crotalus horridus]
MAGAGWAPPQLEDFLLTERLGSGTYATVFKAYRKKNSREVVAIKCNICHLDLKPQNILLSSLEKSHLKLADFGFAQHMSPRDEKHVLRGSPLYMAPEMVCNRQYDARVDLWSVGVILYEAVFGRPPFASKSFAELEEKIRSNQPVELPSRPRLSPECRDLLQRLLQRDPQQRISFQAFFAHPFVDMEHMASAESLGKAAVKKDQEGDMTTALSLYSKALEYFVPALRYEQNAQRKEAIRSKVSDYISRAEQLKVLVASDNKALLEKGCPGRDILKEMSKNKPRLYAALQVASAAVAKLGENICSPVLKKSFHPAGIQLVTSRPQEEEGKEDSETLELYQQSLGELLLMLAGEWKALWVMQEEAGEQEKRVKGDQLSLLLHTGLARNLREEDENYYMLRYVMAVSPEWNLGPIEQEGQLPPRGHF